MIRSIVHHQHHSPGWIFFHQQLLQEVDELRAVLGFSCSPGDPITHPVVPTENVPFLLCSRLRGRNASLLSDFHPARPQRRIEVQRGFVHKDELEIVSENLFFNSSSSSSAFALASLSCKWPKSYFGRRYRYPLAFNSARKRASLSSIPVSLARCRRRRSIVHTVKLYPNSSGSFSTTSATSRSYASSALVGRPLRGLVASSSTPPLRQRLIQV